MTVIFEVAVPPGPVQVIVYVYFPPAVCVTEVEPLMDWAAFRASRPTQDVALVDTQEMVKAEFTATFAADKVTLTVGSLMADAGPLTLEPPFPHAFKAKAMSIKIRVSTQRIRNNCSATSKKASFL
jgi:DUF1365 family protein